jgi:hypothetical protein
MAPAVIMKPFVGVGDESQARPPPQGSRQNAGLRASFALGVIDFVPLDAPESPRGTIFVFARSAVAL